MKPDDKHRNDRQGRADPQGQIRQHEPRPCLGVAVVVLLPDLFAIFSLVPPLYMLITSLKSSAEISAATNPWWVFHPTLSNYIELLTSNQFLTFFLNSALVSIFVVTITMLISVPAAFALARMRFWGSATLATGVFLTYLIPDTLLFLPLFKMFAVIRRLDRNPADQSTGTCC